MEIILWLLFSNYRKDFTQKLTYVLTEKVAQSVACSKLLWLWKCFLERSQTLLECLGRVRDYFE